MTEWLNWTELKLSVYCLSNKFVFCQPVMVFSPERQWHPTPVLLPGESQGRWGGRGGAWWVTVYGVALSRTWLKWLSSSSNSPTVKVLPHLLYLYVWYAAAAKLLKSCLFFFFFLVLNHLKISHRYHETLSSTYVRIHLLRIWTLSYITISIPKKINNNSIISNSPNCCKNVICCIFIVVKHPSQLPF